MIVDVLGPHAEPETLDALLGQLEVRMCGSTAHAMALWMPPWSPWSLHLQRLGFEHVPSPWHLVVRSFDRRITPSVLRDGWWYQLADSDLV